jgi:hypothetical protein
MRPLTTSLLTLSLFTLASACAQGDAIEDDLGEALAVEEGCGDACTVDSTLVGERFALVGRAHDVAGELVVVDDATLAIEGFIFDGGGVDVRAIVAPDFAGLSDDTVYSVLSEDLRRPGGYDGATLRFPLPDGLTVDDVGAFSIWCVPFVTSFGDVELP